MRPKFLKKIDHRVQQDILTSVEVRLSNLTAEVLSPYNDGWTALAYKKQLWELKCLLEDIYDQLPGFGNDELEWEKERVYNKLKGKE